MEDYNRSRSYSYSDVGGTKQMETYYAPQRPPPTSYELRSYSASYAQAQMANNAFDINNYNNKRDFKLKKGKITSGSSSSSKAWSLSDPEFQRKKRVASYKMYSVEGKVKGSFRRSFRWLKDRMETDPPSESEHHVDPVLTFTSSRGMYQSARGLRSISLIQLLIIGEISVHAINLLQSFLQSVITLV